MNQKDKSHNQEMFRLVERWEQSGMSLRAFSKTVVISYEKLRYWKRKFKDTNQNAEQEFHAISKDTPDFIPVEALNKAVGFSYLQISYPNQVKLSCSSDIELDTLKSLIKLF